MKSPPRRRPPWRFVVLPQQAQYGVEFVDGAAGGLLDRGQRLAHELPVHVQDTARGTRLEGDRAECVPHRVVQFAGEPVAYGELGRALLGDGQPVGGGRAEQDRSEPGEQGARPPPNTPPGRAASRSRRAGRARCPSRWRAGRPRRTECRAGRGRPAARSGTPRTAAGPGSSRSGSRRPRRAACTRRRREGGRPGSGRGRRRAPPGRTPHSARTPNTSSGRAIGTSAETAANGSATANVRSESGSEVRMPGPCVQAPTMMEPTRKYGINRAPPMTRWTQRCRARIPNSARITA